MKHSKSKDEEDSESDWDSMTEVHQASKSDKEESSKLKEESDENESSAISQPTHGMKEYNKEENPPYSFKSEVRSPARREKEDRPGKPSKGQTYKPLVKNNTTNKKKYPNFPDEHVTSDSENEEVKNVIYQSSMQIARKGLLTPMKPIHSRKPEERYPSTSLTPNNMTSMQVPVKDGVSNRGYETDEEILFDKDPVMMNGVVVESANYQLEGFPVDSNGKAKSSTERKRSLIHVAETDATIQIFNQSSLQNVNKHLEKGFNYAAFPFVCFFLFFHHLLRFLILHLMKPIFLDTISICSAYFIKPFFSNVLHPVFQNIHQATLSLSQIFINVLKPLIALIRSCRLVEINHRERKDPYLV